MDAIKITSNRIAYIDLFKGIAIIGVVWVHSHIPPSWLTPFLVNSIFFFIIGNHKEFPITRNNSQPKVSRIRYSQRFQPAVLSSQPLVFFLALCFC